MACHYVYYVHHENELVYIGRSSRPSKRLTHFRARTGLPLSVLGVCQRFTNLDDACSAEIAAIQKHRPKFNKVVASSYGTIGIQAGRNSARVWTKEARDKVGRSSKGRNVGSRGYSHSVEARARMSIKATGRIFSDQAKAKMRAARLRFLQKIKEEHEHS